jgi:ATP-dependent helicase/nuclease subunit A
LELVGLLIASVEQKSWASWHEDFQLVSFGKLKPLRGDGYDKQLQEQVKSQREAAKDIVSGLAEELFSRAPGDFLEELWHAAPQMEALSELVIEFGVLYESEKRRRGLVDFGDLEHYCLRILRDPSSTPETTVPSAAAEEFQRQFDEILLDEYQDTNMVQEAIVSLIARPGRGNRFMVGDVKQSIYRFRLAEPNLFLRKYKAYRSGSDVEQSPGTISGQPELRADTGGEGEDGLRIDLARNFRSRREVVDGVNDVFRAIMHETVAEMNYDERAELVCGASYPAAPAGSGGVSRFAVDFVVLDKGDAYAADREQNEAELSAEEEDAAASASAAEAASELQAAQLEARWIAAQIRSLMDGNGKEGPLRVYDGRRKVDRPLMWRDIVILLRATRFAAPLIIEELQALGIPAYAELSSGYFEATEVEVMLSLLRVIDNPYQDIPLAGALRSPIFGLTAEELAQIRIHAGRAPYYEAVVLAADNPALPELTRRKLELFLKRLSSWRDEARQGSLSDLLWRIYRETGYYDLVGGHQGGVQRQANLRALHDRARQYEATSFRGLFRFLRFIERMRDSGGDLGTAGALGEQENVVRIMSIHKSKGLEFPVVFAAGLGKTFNMQDLNGGFLLHKELGFGPKHIDSELRVSYPTLPYLALRRRMRMEMLAEEMRILYVAMTRPKEKMYLVGTVADAGKAVARWRAAAAAGGSRLPDFHLASARRFLDWLMPLVVGGAAEWTEGADGSGPLARGWRFGVTPAALLGMEAAAAAETNEAEEALRHLRLQAVSSLAPVEGTEAAAEIGRRLSWTYPFAAATQVAAKTSVTEMKRMRAETVTDDYAERVEELALANLAAAVASAAADSPPEAGGNWLSLPEPAVSAGGTAVAGGLQADGSLGGAFTFRLRRPRFMEDVSLTPAERGTASHLFMQYVPLGGIKDEQTLLGTLQEMIERQLLTPQQAAAIDIPAIAAFFAGELGGRMVAAEWIRREVPFSCGVPAGRIHAKAAVDGDAADEPVLIQGVVDCLFEDANGLVLLDYKTDRIFLQDWEKAAEKHRFQLELYAEAVGRIIGKEVNECHVFFFDGGQSVRLR